MMTFNVWLRFVKVNMLVRLSLIAVEIPHYPSRVLRANTQLIANAMYSVGHH